LSVGGFNGSKFLIRDGRAEAGSGSLTRCTVAVAREVSDIVNPLSTEVGPNVRFCPAYCRTFCSRLQAGNCQLASPT
jgi:hypothetical protein